MNLKLPVFSGVLGALIGAVLAEFFPDKISSGLGNIFLGAISEPFCPYRNGLAFKWAIIGLVVGAVIGLLIIIATKKTEGNPGKGA